jgi:hypothetical protein
MTDLSDLSRKETRARRLHLVTAFVVCLVLPGGSWLSGNGWLAWRMYSSSESYRVSIMVWDVAGRGRRVAPTEVAARAGASGLAVFLSGAEQWRRDPVGPALAAHAFELAGFACRCPGAARVRLTVEHRRHLDDPGRAVSVQRPCMLK